MPTTSDYTTKDQQRRTLLQTFARTMEEAAVRGLFGHPIGLHQTTLVNGPRAGALEIGAGFESGALLRALQSDDGATLRQLIPWNFIGEPSAFMSGRCVRLEAGWPGDIAEDDIPLATLGKHPAGDGRWLVGRNECGNVLTAGLSDRSPHWLVSGTTGSGKTTAMLSMIGQLCQDTDNRLVLIDAKHGASLRGLGNVRGLVGPLADDVTSARAALAWCTREMAARYSGARDTRRLIVVIDEVQDIANDTTAAELLRQLVVQGRGASVHVVVATQHPVVASLGGPTVGRNLVGRLALRVADADASRVALGASSPRADHLLGRGDSYAVAPGVTHRTQVAYLDFIPPTTDRIDIDEWPDDLDVPDSSGWPTGPEVGAAIMGAASEQGRSRFQRSASEMGVKVADNNKAVRLLGLARGALDFLHDHGATVCLSESETTLVLLPDRAGGGQNRVRPSRQTDRQIVIDGSDIETGGGYYEMGRQP